MLAGLSQRLLPALQLTRMALVFTAIADTLCTLLLWAEMNRRTGGPQAALGDYITVGQVIAVVLISVGLYGFGMSLNDIIDHRRDRLVAAHRPLPSGRIGLGAAHVICLLMLCLALGAGAYYSAASAAGFRSLLLVAWVAALIAFYDLMGKYLVWPGLLSLGLIRFFHALIPAPEVPLLWHPLLLLNHVALLSALCYWWEEKRPPLTRGHVWTVAGALVAVNVLLVTLIGPNGLGQNGSERGILFALAAVLFFLAVALAIRRRSASRREAGERLMLAGLLWLIVYDAAFVAGYVSVGLGALLLGLLPVAWWSVRLMRWWSKVLSLSQRPKFQRVEI
jgi:hypothetical protein